MASRKLAKKSAPRAASPAKTREIANLKARLARVGAKGRKVASRNEQTLLTFAGASLPALLKRFDVELPTIGDVEPGLLYGGVTMLLSSYVGGKNGDRLFALGTGMSAPAVAKAITTGSIKVSGDDDDDELDELDDGEL